MPKRVLITAGGTLEKIDDVRSIQNTGSGRLGSLIADAFHKASYDVHYVCSEKAHRPQSEVEIFSIQGVLDLETEMAKLLEKHRYDAVIHSMAVSDFFVDKVYSESSVYAQEWEALTDAKISSEEGVFLHLRPAPKVIRLIKDKQPETLLFGFKLLSGASDDDLKEAAEKQIASVGSDFVIANHAEKIQGDHHEAFIFDRNLHIIGECEDKASIAEAILKIVKERR